MVSGVNNGFQTPIPGATTFKPGENSAQNNQSNTVNAGQDNISAAQTPALNKTTIQNTTETQNNRPLSRENTNPLASQDLLSTSPRGSQLDISV